MKTREPVIVAKRRLVLHSKVFLPGEHITPDVWARIPFSKREILSGNGYTAETGIPPTRTGA